MLFLLRPSQTWMPFGLPQNRSEQQAYNRKLEQSYVATHRVDRASPAQSGSTESDPVASLRELSRLHESGALTDQEFAAAKGRVLDGQDDWA